MAGLEPTKGQSPIIPKPPGNSGDRKPVFNIVKLRKAGRADSNGNCVIEFPVPSSAAYHLERARVITNGGACRCEFYDTVQDDLHSVDFTPAGNDNLMDNSKKPYFPPGSSIIVVWSGCSSGDACKVNMQVVSES
jgi:hypothetical protein